MNRVLPLVYVVMVIAGIVAGYHNTLHSPFVFDDQSNILLNERVRIDSLAPDSLAKVFPSGKYVLNRPVAFLSFALNYLSGGYDPVGYHAVNILIHMLTALLVLYLFLWYCEHTGFARRDAMAMAVVMASVWAFHPLQTNAVTYIVQRMTSLCALFFIASLVVYLQARDIQTKNRESRCGGGVVLLYGLAFVLWLLAMLTKEIAAIMPVVLVLHEIYFFGPIQDARIFQKKNWYFWGVFLILVALFFYFYFWPWMREVVQSGYVLRDFTLTERLLTQPRVILYYISLYLFPLPSRLTLFHDFPVSRSLLAPPATLISIVIVVAVFFAASFSLRKYRLISFGIVWTMICLLIESSFLPLELIYEHRFYLPSIGFTLAVVLFSFRLLQRFRRGKMLFYLGWSGAICGLVLLTYTRNQDWQSGVTVYRDAAQKAPNLVRVVNGLGIEYVRAGEYEMGVKTLRRALEIDPGNIVVLANLFVFYSNIKSRETAEQYLVTLLHSVQEGHFQCNQIMNIYLVSKVLAAENRYRDILVLLHPIEKCGTREAVYYDNLGICYLWLGDEQDALENFRKAVNLEPDNPRYLLRLVQSYLRVGDRESAAKYYREIRGLSPSPDMKPELEQLERHLLKNLDP